MPQATSATYGGTPVSSETTTNPLTPEWSRTTSRSAARAKQYAAQTSVCSANSRRYAADARNQAGNGYQAVAKTPISGRPTATETEIGDPEERAEHHGLGEIDSRALRDEADESLDDHEGRADRDDADLRTASEQHDGERQRQDGARGDPGGETEQAPARVEREHRPDGLDHELRQATSEQQPPRRVGQLV